MNAPLAVPETRGFAPGLFDAMRNIVLGGSSSRVEPAGERVDFPRAFHLGRVPTLGRQIRVWTLLSADITHFRFTRGGTDS
jgi:hypothetical protein